MSIEKNVNLAKLQHSFPQLTDMNQQYMLGIAVGLKYVQENFKETPNTGKETFGKWQEPREAMKKLGVV